jgi:hypothetical protein
MSSDKSRRSSFYIESPEAARARESRERIQKNIREVEALRQEKGQLESLAKKYSLKAEAIRAFLEGKPIQSYNEFIKENGGWVDWEPSQGPPPLLDNPYAFYRPKP